VSDEGEISDKSDAKGFAGWITGHTRFPLGGFADFGYVLRFLHLFSPEIG
jgi:hypothetical protein